MKNEYEKSCLQHEKYWAKRFADTGENFAWLSWNWWLDEWMAAL